MSNFGMRVTRNACISMTLQYPKTSFQHLRESEGYEGRSTHANRHPRQPLTPPENVALDEQGSVFNTRIETP